MHTEWKTAFVYNNHIVLYDFLYLQRFGKTTYDAHFVLQVVNIIIALLHILQRDYDMLVYLL